LGSKEGAKRKRAKEARKKKRTRSPTSNTYMNAATKLRTKGKRRIIRGEPSKCRGLLPRERAGDRQGGKRGTETRACGRPPRETTLEEPTKREKGKKNRRETGGGIWRILEALKWPARTRRPEGKKRGGKKGNERVTKQFPTPQRRSANQRELEGPRREK